MAKYLACICEGGAERAILDLLLDNHKLIFERVDLIEEEVLKCRRGREFEEKYLKKGFSEILINALHEYKRISKIRRNEKTLWDLLK